MATTNSLDKSSSLGGNYRWFICFLLFAATTINYIDRQIFGLLKPELEKVFGWSEMDYSRIVMAFTVCYACGLLVYGRIIDKIGTRLGYTISVTIWSAVAMLHSAVRSTLGFGIVRALLGIGESGNYPAGVKTVGEWFPPKERALAIGILDSMVRVFIRLRIDLGVKSCFLQSSLDVVEIVDLEAEMVDAGKVRSVRTHVGRLLALGIEDRQVDVAVGQEHGAVRAAPQFFEPEGRFVELGDPRRVLRGQRDMPDACHDRSSLK